MLPGNEWPHMPGNKVNPRGFVVDRRNNFVVGKQVLVLLQCGCSKDWEVLCLCWKAEKIVCCHELNSQKLQQSLYTTFSSFIEYIHGSLPFSNQWMLRLDDFGFWGNFLEWFVCFIGVLVSLWVLPAFLSFCRTWKSQFQRKSPWN